MKANDFFSLLKILTKSKVDYVVIGGFACVVHGYTYVTQDIDLCLDFTIDNLMRLQKAIKTLHPVHRMTPKKIKLNLTEENCSHYKNLYLNTDKGQIDCISYVDGVGDFKTVKGRSILIEINKIKISVLDIDAIIESKQALNRDKDLQALIQLKTLKKLKNNE